MHNAADDRDAILRDCDEWLASRQPAAGKSAVRVESLRKRIAAVLE